MNCAEDIRFDASETSNSFCDEDDDTYRTLMSPFISTGDTDFYMYAQIMKEYSSRSLTKQTDIEHALAGVLQVMETMFKNSAFWLNMPLALLDAALLWHPTGPLSRRTCPVYDDPVPSWSWAGWIGPVSYFESIINPAERLLVPDWTQLSEIFPIKPGQWSKQENCPEWSRFFADYGATYAQSTWNGNDLKGARFARPTLAHAAQIIGSDLLTGEGYLKFDGQVASFRMTMDHLKHASIPISSRCTDNNHVACYLGVFDDYGKQCGYVVVDGKTSQTLRSGLYDFVRLSQMTLTHTEDDPAWDEDTQAFSREPGKPGDTSKYEWFTASGKPERELYFDNTVYNPTIAWCLYNVMMVEWKDGVGYRLGIGSMHITAWENSSPIAQEVVLG